MKPLFHRKTGALLRLGNNHFEVRAHVLPDGEIGIVDWFGETIVGTRVMTMSEALALGDFVNAIVRSREVVAA